MLLRSEFSLTLFGRTLLRSIWGGLLLEQTLVGTVEPTHKSGPIRPLQFGVLSPLDFFSFCLADLFLFLQVVFGKGFLQSEILAEVCLLDGCSPG